MKNITPCLWFDTQAEEAANLYVSIFKDSSIGKITRYGKEGFEVHGMPEGTVLTVAFTLNGQEYTALNGGPAFKFTEAVSFQVPCESQEEIDYYWEKLLEGGKPSQCGWLWDKFGLSWQVYPVQMQEMLADPDPKKAAAAMHAMMQMVKIDLPAIQEAYDNA